MGSDRDADNWTEEEVKGDGEGASVMAKPMIMLALSLMLLVVGSQAMCWIVNQLAR